MADVSPDVLEAVAVTCVKCWKETHQPPPASALYLMDDYKWETGHQVRLENEAAQLARGDGYQGTLDDLQHAAHREMYARGDDAQLDKMLRHVAYITQTPGRGSSSSRVNRHPANSAAV